MVTEQYRLITRRDFDGLVCAALLKELDLICDIYYAHPKDVQDGKVPVTHQDIITNLPYVAEAYRVFDHHASEVIRLQTMDREPTNLILDTSSPSAARVVFNYYGGFSRFSEHWDEVLKAVDKADSANFTIEDILDPGGWELLNFLLDPRTGLGRFREFATPDIEFSLRLIDDIREKSIWEILNDPDVREREDLYFDHEDRFKEQLRFYSTVYGNVVVLNLQDEFTLFPGNRFMIYALYPQCSISIYVMWGFSRQNTVFAVGKSIINRASNANIGALMLEYGGGGHHNAGTCQVDNDHAKQIMQDLIERLQDS